jgi:hypothetical protein
VPQLCSFFRLPIAWSSGVFTRTLSFLLVLCFFSIVPPIAGCEVVIGTPGRLIDLMKVRDVFLCVYVCVYVRECACLFEYVST